MEERSIRVELAGRAYPLTIMKEEEANVRHAVKEINDSIARLKEHYPLTDKQDLLAMAALEVTVRALNTAGLAADQDTVDGLVRLERTLQEALAP